MHFHVSWHFHAIFMLGDKLLNILRISALVHHLKICKAMKTQKHKMPNYNVNNENCILCTYRPINYFTLLTCYKICILISIISSPNNIVHVFPSCMQFMHISIWAKIIHFIKDYIVQLKTVCCNEIKYLWALLWLVIYSDRPIRNQERAMHYYYYFFNLL